jgi:hypothetical protein
VKPRQYYSWWWCGNTGCCDAFCLFYVFIFFLLFHVENNGELASSRKYTCHTSFSLMFWPLRLLACFKLVTAHADVGIPGAVTRFCFCCLFYWILFASRRGKITSPSKQGLLLVPEAPLRLLVCFRFGFTFLHYDCTVLALRICVLFCILSALDITFIFLSVYCLLLFIGNSHPGTICKAVSCPCVLVLLRDALVVFSICWSNPAPKAQLWGKRGQRMESTIECRTFAKYKFVLGTVWCGISVYRVNMLQLLRVKAEARLRTFP